MTLPDEVEALSTALTNDLKKVWEAIQTELTTLEDLPSASAAREHKLLRIETQIRELLAQADDIAAQHILNALEGAFTFGALTTYAMAGVIVESIPIGAVVALARDTMQDILAATKYVDETTKTLLRAIARDEILNHVTIGQTPQQTAKHIRDLMAEHQVHAVTYKNGAKHGLGSYAEMLVRTKTAEAYTAGTLTAAEELEIGFWEVLDGPGCGWLSHDDPVKADGLIVTTQEAREHPIAHPNCRRDMVARIDIETLDDIAEAGRLPDDVWEGSREVALQQWGNVKTTSETVGDTVRSRIEQLSPAEAEHRRLIQAKAS